MNKFLFLIIPLVFIFTSCQNKTKRLITKKWDCVQVENLAPIDKNFINKEDSAIALKIEEALTALNWTFNANNTYQCSVGSKITVQGFYEIKQDNSLLTCTTLNTNAVNNYLISNISETELTLTSTGTAIPLILHFRPN